MKGQEYVYMALLAVQFGIQPGLVRAFAPQSLCRSSYILIQELMKVFIAAFGLFSSGEKKYSETLEGWTILKAFHMAGIPAFLYAIQSMVQLIASQNLEPLTFNVLNQTKTLSAAFFCYLVIGRKQSPVQIFALILLLLSALVMEEIISINVFSVESNPAQPLGESIYYSNHWMYGVIPALCGSALSGLAGAIAQKNLQGDSEDGLTSGRDPYLFSLELNFFSSSIILFSMMLSSDGDMIKNYGFFYGWTPSTLIPITSNAFGGIIVGLVTKYSGSVRKGFALIFGIFISGMLQSIRSAEGLKLSQCIGGLLVAASLWLHSINPDVGDCFKTLPKYQPIINSSNGR